MGELADRRREAKSRIERLRAELAGTEKRSEGKACVYATGSFGREEASVHSDLDVFIVGKVDDEKKSLLKRLDEICIKADLIDVTKKLEIQEFSGDGQYLQYHTVHDLINTLGKPNDDVANTFTARLLLLLESRSLVETSVYNDVIGDVIAAYWGDYEDHKNDFMPAFLANDILRLWRTFCVNYEAGTKKDPAAAKAKRKLKNYKLKHSRLLTCYSALLYLLALYQKQGTVSPDDANAMSVMTPTERLEWLGSRPFLVEAHENIGKLLKQYERFLVLTAAPESELVGRLQDKNESHMYFKEANDFGDRLYDVLKSIGKEGPFHRLLVV